MGVAWSTLDCNCIGEETLVEETEQEILNSWARGDNHPSHSDPSFQDIKSKFEASKSTEQAAPSDVPHNGEGIHDLKSKFEHGANSTHVHRTSNGEKIQDLKSKFEASKGTEQAAPAHAPHKSNGEGIQGLKSKYQTSKPTDKATTDSTHKPKAISVEISKRPCTLCNSNVLEFEASKDSKGLLFHKACLKCNMCHKDLASIEYVIDGQALLCARTCHVKKVQDQAIAEGKTTVVAGAVAGLKRRASTKGDVDGVKETIGAELEAAIDGMIPRCETCGSKFAGNDPIIMIGSFTKYHKDCYENGKPMRSADEEDMNASMGAKYIDDRLCLRFGCNGKQFTYFLQQEVSREDPQEIKRRKQKMKDLGGTMHEIDFIFDLKSHSPARRKCPAPADGRWTEAQFTVEAVPDDYHNSWELEQVRLVRNGEEEFSGEVHCLLTQQRFGLIFSMDLHFECDAVGYTVECKDARVTIQTSQLHLRGFDGELKPRSGSVASMVSQSTEKQWYLETFLDEMKLCADAEGRKI